VLTVEKELQIYGDEADRYGQGTQNTTDNVTGEQGGGIARDADSLTRDSFWRLRPDGSDEEDPDSRLGGDLPEECQNMSEDNQFGHWGGSQSYQRYEQPEPIDPMGPESGDPACIDSPAADILIGASLGCPDQLVQCDPESECCCGGAGSMAPRLTCAFVDCEEGEALNPETCECIGDQLDEPRDPTGPGPDPCDEVCVEGVDCDCV